MNIDEMRENCETQISYFTQHGSPRNAEIARRVLGGETLAGVGRAFGLSPERVRQITYNCYRMKSKHEARENARRISAEARAAAREELRQACDGTPIIELELSIRAFNVLKEAGITGSGEMAQLTYEEIMQLPNAGRKTAIEIIEMSKWLAERNRNRT